MCEVAACDSYTACLNLVVLCQLTSALQRIESWCSDQNCLPPLNAAVSWLQLKVADTLTQVVGRLKQPDDYWFILIDQFEELFTTSLADKRNQFIKSLVSRLRCNASYRLKRSQASGSTSGTFFKTC